MKKINCFCGKNFEIEFDENINLLERPEVVDQIINNNFMVFTCPKCSKKLTPEFTTTFKDSTLNITMVPEINRGRLLAGKLLLKTEQVVVGFPELQEKFIIRKFNFDDRIIEIIKLYLLEKVDFKLEISILFHNYINNELIFYISGLKEKETAISKIPLHIYNNIKDDLDNKLKDADINELLAFPYRSVNKIRPEVK